MYVSINTANTRFSSLCKWSLHKENASHTFLFCFSSLSSQPFPYSPLSICAKDLSSVHLFFLELSLSCSLSFHPGIAQVQQIHSFEEYDSCLTTFYKPPITSHNSSPPPVSILTPLTSYMSSYELFSSK